MIATYVEHIKALLHDTAIGQIPWLYWFAASVIDFLTSPLTGLRTRSYWPELVAGIAIAAIVFVLRERLVGQGVRDFFRFCFPKSMYIHRSTWVDCQIIIANNFLAPLFNVTWRMSAAAMTTAGLAGLVWLFGPAPHAFGWTTLTLVVLTILVGVADDFGYYLFHLTAHRVRWLWAFHKVHHTAETLTVFANVRVHPVELAVTGPFKAVTVALVMAPALYLSTGDATLIDVFGMNMMAAFYALVGSQLHHTNIWLSWGRTLEHVFISPAQHQIHHSTAPQHWNRNMGGNFALWDWMFGTLYVTQGREKLTYGLGSAPQPHNSVVSAYLEPFLELVPLRDKLVASGHAWLSSLQLALRQGTLPRPRGEIRGRD